MALYNIAGFTDVGTSRDTNQDRILIGGDIVESGMVFKMNQSSFSSFVADGVGGNLAGEYASNFILTKILDFNGDYINLSRELEKSNLDLIAHAAQDVSIKGCATTLSGLIGIDEKIIAFHAGDSQIWLWRNDLFFKLTRDQVFDEYEENSPLTSFFGGHAPHLELITDIAISESQPGDILAICSDGLFKSLSSKAVKTILGSGQSLQMKSENILRDCLSHGADDNVSLILIEALM